jgi:hypothetical protein
MRRAQSRGGKPPRRVEDGLIIAEQAEFVAEQDQLADDHVQTLSSIPTAMARWPMRWRYPSEPAANVA